MKITRYFVEIQAQLFWNRTIKIDQRFEPDNDPKVLTHSSDIYKTLLF